ncbi:MAG: molybdate ABC transporter substrate-binding protein [Acidobacteriota bacterium]|nr:molybdate ABC transporter substrate-binding protein [Acidobacteriota bacterium]
MNQRLHAHCAGWRRLRAGLLLALVCALSACRTQHRTVLTVSVAASLGDAIQEVEAVYQREHPDVSVRNNFGSSGTLAQQIEHGAPVDVFLSAAAEPMDELEARGLIIAETRRNLLRNTLVLVAPRDSTLHSFQQLAGESVRTIALGDPGSVPAGRYGQQTLAALHLLDAVRAKLVLAGDVRAVLAYVATGNADAGIVYATDALVSGKVRVVAAAPEGTHDPIVYPEAAIRSGRNEAGARTFAEYLSTPTAKAIFVKHGFTMASQ